MGWMYVEAEKWNAWWQDNGVLYMYNPESKNFTMWTNWGAAMPAMIGASKLHLRKLILAIFIGQDIRIEK